MRLACIYNVWADAIELLPYSINSIIDCVDIIIIVKQDISNYGERIEYDLFSDAFRQHLAIPMYIINYTPNLKTSGMVNETAKRNLGIEKAKELGCSHFLCMDSDEMYYDFYKAKHEYINSGKDGSYCSMWTYFKTPILRLANKEKYFVPFIHKLHHHTISGKSPYPVYTDPTRRINTTDVIEISEPMHHFSYVRKDIDLKLRNSSARANIIKGKIREDYFCDVKEGSYIRDFEQKLVSVENIFNIHI